MKRIVCDVAVVGLGAVGASALYQLARHGAEVVGIDQFAPPHTHGSSHGESRITRQAIGEGEAYVPLVLRSNAIWEGLEEQTGETLLERCGFLCITRDDLGTQHHGKSGFLGRTRVAAENFNITHEMLGADELRYRFAQFAGLIGDEIAYYEPGGGLLRPERCVATALAQATRHGAEILINRRVSAIVREAGGIKLSTTESDIYARHAIIATGAWIADYAGPLVAAQVAVHRQLLHWFAVENSAAYRSGATPTFIWTHGLTTREQFYGFPPIGGFVKVAREDYTGTGNPDMMNVSIDPAEGQAMAKEHVNGRLAGLAAMPSRTQDCRYAVTSDADFLIDADDQLQIVSACSGHGFKHAAAIGEAVAEVALTRSPSIDLSPFSASRFKN